MTWPVRSFLFGALPLALALVALGPGAVSGAPRKASTHRVESVVVRDLPGDALRTDGGLFAYANPPVTAFIEDRVRGAGQYKIKDTFFFEVSRTDDARHLKVHVPGIIENDLGGPLSCEVGQVEALSWASPDWYNSTAVGSSVTGDGVLRCYLDAQRTTGWIVGYPDFADECLQISRPETRTWTFQAPQSCPSAVWRVENGQYITPAVREFSAGVGAPWHVTARQPQT